MKDELTINAVLLDPGCIDQLHDLRFRSTFIILNVSQFWKTRIVCKHMSHRFLNSLVRVYKKALIEISRFYTDCGLHLHMNSALASLRKV